ncbi:hypothetical protein ACMZ7N_00320 [Gardnerella pickettii]|uniref:Uncharacterized protein n=1 Tax=Gardnerella pickettii JCP7719 TaxID=1261061 RepID=S4GX83_9BIFI|nr:hypothetical protein HMPREF1576_00803 [Gardnerella pickettii JCP7719]
MIGISVSIPTVEVSRSDKEVKSRDIAEHKHRRSNNRKIKSV